MAKPVSTSEPTVYSALVVQAILARVTCSIHEAILHTSPAPTVDKIKEYDNQIIHAVKLPPYYSTCSTGPYHFALRIQRWRINDFRAILYRPILLAAAWDTRNGGSSTKSPATQEAIE